VTADALPARSWFLAGAARRAAPVAAGLLVLLAVLAGAWNTVAGARARDAAASASGTLLQAEALLSAMKDVETGQRGFLLTGRDEYLRPFNDGTAEAARRLAALEGVAPPDRAARLRDLVRRRIEQANRGLEIRDREGPDAAARFVGAGEGKATMDALRAEVEALQTAQRAEIAALERRDRERAALLNLAALLSVLAACALAGAYALARRRAERGSRALLEDVLENAPVGLGFLDRSLRFRHANRALAKLGEHALGVEVGSAVRDLSPDLREQVEPRLRAVLAEGRTFANLAVDTRPPDRPGETRHLRMGFFPLHGDGGVEGVGLAVTDVTLRRRAELRLRQREAQFRAVAESIPQLAWMTDAEGAITWYNKRWLDYTGKTLEELRGWGWRQVHDPEHVERVEAGFRRCLETGEPWEDTFPLRGKDGGWRWFLSRAVPVREEAEEGGAEGTVTGWFGTNTDITEMRKAEEQLAEAKEAAEEANRAKSQFIANMSHELRTPLSAVIGYSEMLEEEAAEIEGADTMQDDLRKINGNARHLLSLINDVLDLSKIEAGKMEVQAEDFDAAAVVREVGDTVQALMARKSNTLELDLAPDLDGMHSDPVKLRQCLFNLLGNAAKFTENGRITLSARRAPPGPEGAKQVEFSVADTGIGMTEEQLGRLFRRFSQADDSTTRRFGGTGLGLSITKAFCAMLGGDISVESKPGEGTAFTIRVPADFRDVSTPQETVAEDAASGAEGNGHAGTVLVVDDDEASRDLLVRFLRREGFAVRTAPHGAAALPLARELKPSAVLLDVMMPHMDGWAVLSAMKAEPELAEIPVIMVTFVQEKGLGFSLGAADYLVKPVQWARLKEVLDRYRSPGAALVMEGDPETRAELRRLLEGEGWTVEEAADRAAVLRRMNEAPLPGLVLAAVPADGEGLELIGEIRRHPEWRSVPLIALAESQLSADEAERLRGQVRRVVRSEDDLPDELVAELRRIAAGRAAPSKAPEAAAATP